MNNEFGEHDGHLKNITVFGRDIKIGIDDKEVVTDVMVIYQTQEVMEDGNLRHGIGWSSTPMSGALALGMAKSASMAYEDNMRIFMERGN